MNDADALTDFADILALEAVAPDRFAASTPGRGSHLFGGVTFGLAARAAALTVDEGRHLHAATCQFVAAGACGLDVDIEVERVRDGRQLSLRRVSITGRDRLLFSCDAWFSPEEPGVDWQPEAPADDRREARQAVAPLRSIGIDPLEVVSLRSAEDAALLHVHPFWARSRHGVGHDRALNLGALAFLSDLCTVALVNTPADRSGAVMSPFSTTLNHTLWVHRRFSMDNWLRVDGQPLSVHGNRGLATGSLHDEDGTLVASFCQESMAPSPR